MSKWPARRPRDVVQHVHLPSGDHVALSSASQPVPNDGITSGAVQRALQAFLDDRADVSAKRRWLEDCLNDSNVKRKPRSDEYF